MMNNTDDQYWVSEIFQSIQGEGNFCGVNCLFIRFQFCNLTCSWCDTKYTWLRKSGKHTAYTADELKNIINNTSCHHIIFTGGEPCLYRLDKLVVPGKKFHVESNGTIIPWQKTSICLADGTTFQREAMDISIIRDFNWVISPKLSNSNQILDKTVLKSLYEKDLCTFKFIIDNENDLFEVAELANELAIAKDKIYIGLEGTNIQDQLRPEMVDKIIAAGFNFSPRLHIMLWGPVKGK